MSDKVKVTNLSSEEHKIRSSVYEYLTPHSRYGEGGYIMSAEYVNHADTLRAMQVRPDDTWVVSFPRTGTTMTQELLWLLRNNLDFTAAKNKTLEERYYFIEIFDLFYCNKNPVSAMLKAPAEIAKIYGSIGYLEADKEVGPRFLKTHLPLSLLPPTLLDVSKVVYIARDPRDVIVSRYHHSLLFGSITDKVEFKAFWECFLKDLSTWSPFFNHLKEAWAQKDHPNMLFLFYEDVVKDLNSACQLLSKFYNKDYSKDDITKLCSHMNFDNFKNNRAVNNDWTQQLDTYNEKVSFIRKGSSGSWEKYFDEDMKRLTEDWMRQNLANTDLRFPTFKM